MTQEEEERRRRALEWLRKAGEERRELARRYGVYPGDLVAEVREERSRHWDEFLAEEGTSGDPDE